MEIVDIKIVNIKSFIINIILFVILIFEICFLILYYIKFKEQYKFNNFMSTICYEHDDLCYALEEVFNHYSDTSGLGQAFECLGILFFMAIIILAVIIVLILKYFVKYSRTKLVCQIILLLFSLLVTGLIYFRNGIEAKYKVDISDDKIYIFDDEFNKEIKNNFDFMFKRKIYLVVYSIAIAVGIIAHIIIILIFKDDKEIFSITQVQNNQQSNNSTSQQNNNSSVKIDINQQ